MPNPAAPILAEVMQTAHLSPSEAATAVGASESTVRRIISGQTKSCRRPIHTALESLRDTLRIKQRKVA